MTTQAIRAALDYLPKWLQPSWIVRPAGKCEDDSPYPLAIVTATGEYVIAHGGRCLKETEANVIVACVNDATLLLERLAKVDRVVNAAHMIITPMLPRTDVIKDLALILPPDYLELHQALAAFEEGR